MSSREPKPQSQLEIVYQPPSALKADPRNPRNHSKRHVRQLAKSMEAFAFNTPILIDQDGVIIAGHGRKQAAELLGMPSVPIICLSHLNEHQRRAFVVADNRLGDLSNWNQGTLKEIMLELSEADLNFDIDAVGFSIAEIDLMTIDAFDPEDGADDLPPTGPAVTQPGDIWTLGDHMVICGSALDEDVYDRLMGRERAHLVFSDPPYNVRIPGNVSGLGKIKHVDFVQASGEMSEAEFIAFLNSGLRHASTWSHEGSLHYWAMDWRHQYELAGTPRALCTSLSPERRNLRRAQG